MELLQNFGCCGAACKFNNVHCRTSQKGVKRVTRCLASHCAHRPLQLQLKSPVSLRVVNSVSSCTSCWSKYEMTNQGLCSILMIVTILAQAQLIELVGEVVANWFTFNFQVNKNATFNPLPPFPLCTWWKFKTLLKVRWTVARLEICQEIYTTKFSAERILHTKNT